MGGAEIVVGGERRYEMKVEDLSCLEEWDILAKGFNSCGVEG